MQEKEDECSSSEESPVYVIDRQGSLAVLPGDMNSFEADGGPRTPSKARQVSSQGPSDDFDMPNNRSPKTGHPPQGPQVTPRRAYARIQGPIDLCGVSVSPVCPDQDQRRLERPMRTLDAYRENVHGGSAVIDKVIAEISSGRPLLPLPKATGRFPGRVNFRSSDGSNGLDVLDITSISRGLPLSDQQVDWVLGTISQYHRLPDKCIVFSSHFIPFLSFRDGQRAVDLDDTVRQYHEVVYEATVRRCQDRVTPSTPPFMSMGKILAPFYVGNCHWCLALVEPKNSRVIQLFDPCGINGPNRDDVDMFSRSLLAYCESQENFEKGSVPKPWSLSNFDCDCDADVGESGVYVCAYARAILTGCSPSSVKRGTSKKTRMEMSVLALELIVCPETDT